jgi:Transglycosylase SLT domain
MSVEISSATATAAVDPSRVRIAGAIKQAANTTGISFEYLLATAKMESNFNPRASASTSSARGLYQFIDQTWLGTVKEAGAQLGYGKYADAITKSPSGSYSVSDPAARSAIMKLRDDPDAASSMAAVLTQSNSFRLTGKIGRRPTDGELYMAHFMGVGGAARLISNAEDNPNSSAARLFPNAAAANRSIFFDRSGTRAQRLRSLFGFELALRRRRQLTGDAHRHGGRRRHADTRDVRECRSGDPADRQCPLSLGSSGSSLRHAGHDGIRAQRDQYLAADRSDLPLAVSGRRTDSAGVVDGS